MDFDDVIAYIEPPDDACRPAARSLHDRLTKPVGSLGRLEALGAQLCAIAGEVPPPPPQPAVITVFAGDHGVVTEGVTEWPQDVTAQMAANMCRGGAAINAVAGAVGATVHVVDVGVRADVRHVAGIAHHKIAHGTRNIRIAPAMTLEQAQDAVTVGAEIALRLVADGARCLVAGEIGVGNSTTAAALLCAATGADPWRVAGRGAGASEQTLETKRRVIAEAVDRSGCPDDPIELLAEVGGFEIAALVGYCLGSARARVPVVLDGAVSLVAALLAVELAPPTRGVLVAGHRPADPTAQEALERLRLEPLLDLDLRVGEGTGGALALPLVVAAATVMRGMARFDDGTVAEPGVLRHA